MKDSLQKHMDKAKANPQREGSNILNDVPLYRAITERNDAEDEVKALREAKAELLKAGEAMLSEDKLDAYAGARMMRAAIAKHGGPNA